MNKRDLKHGNVVETREGFRYLYINDKSSCSGFDWLVNLDKKDFDIKNIYNYRDDLTYDHMALHYLDIIKVYKDYTCRELLWERKEPIKLSDDEKTILKNMNNRCKYIVRDKDNRLFIYEKIPIKMKHGWCTDKIYDFFRDFDMYSHLFQFIKWEDAEPYLIEDLLKE